MTPSANSSAVLDRASQPDRESGMRCADTGMVDRAGLAIAAPLAAFLEEEVLPGTGRDVGQFWQGFAGIMDRFAPRNARLLAVRESLQAQIDDWHRDNPDAGTGAPEARTDSGQGTRIVHALAEQLGGELTRTRDHGVAWALEFPPSGSRTLRPDA